MPEQSTSTSYSVREASDLCGVSTDTIKRRLADDRFPGANQQPGRTGPEWRIPAADLAQVATEDGWTLDLATAEQQQESQQEQRQGKTIRELVDRIQAESVALATATAKLEQSEGKTAQLDEALKQARSDSEHWRSEHDRRTQELAESDKAKAVAEALAEERKTELERERSEHLDQLDQQAKTLAERDAELVSMGDRSIELEKERSEALSEAAKLKDSMGWWSRRRYERK